MRKRKIAVFAAVLGMLCIPVRAEQCNHELEYYEDPGNCTEEGYSCYICSICGHSEGYTNLPALDHDMGQWIRISEADCTQPGLERSECSRCGEVLEREIPLTEHSYARTVVEPTCTEQGCVKHTCTRCGYEEKTDLVQPLGHTMEENLIQPTCKAEGYTLLVCSVCDQREKTDVVPELGHDYQSTVTEPTCTAGGYTRHVCSRCEDSYRTDTTQKLGHSYDEGVLTKEPTLTTMGRITYSCTRCDDTYTETTPKWDNPFRDLDKKAYYFDGVLWAFNNGITNGMDAQNFGPDGSCTRAQVVTFLWRQAGEPVPQGKPPGFSDVPEDAYYYDPVCWALEQGITQGISDTRFEPDGICTRAQVVTFLYRLHGDSTADWKEVFGDVMPQNYFYHPVYWAYAKGITTGTAPGLFSPHIDCTRGQVVTLLYRARNLPEDT